MKGQKQLFSSGKDDWGTPPAFTNYLKNNWVGNFDWDLAASKENSICKKYIDEKDDFLKIKYGRLDGIAWLNPPYSLNAEFIAHAYELANKDFTIYCLVPSRTDTDWWHRYVLRSDCIFNIKGRLKFVGASSGAPFPSSIIVFREKIEDAVCPQVVSMTPTPKERGF